jgi:threonine-phosphate decarboxylase
VIRSLTKFYGCPALRVGYAVGMPASLGRLTASLPTWPVTLLALNALAEALRDEPYARRTLQGNAVERARLGARLAALGLRVFPSAANYLLLQLPPEGPASGELRARLIREHSILVRNCDSYAGLETGRYLRVAVRSAGENDRLLSALQLGLKG